MDRALATRYTAIRRKLSDNLARVRDKIGESASKVDRDPEKITLVAVTKTVDLEVIRALLELGHHDIGESRVQQLIQRAGMIREHLARRAILYQGVSTTGGTRLNRCCP